MARAPTAQAQTFDREELTRAQDMALVFVSGMAVILALCEAMRGPGAKPASAIAGELVQMARRTTGFADYVVHQLGARRLHPHEVGVFFPTLPRLCKQAGLATSPAIYLIPGPALNAFALGDPSRSAILVTEGLLAALGREEMAGVLAHEIGHILNGDAYLLAFADQLNKLVASATVMPLLTMALRGRPPARQPAGDMILPLLWLIVAPILSRLLQCALSRIREFEADRIATHILGQPFWLVGALEKLKLHAPMAQGSGSSSPPCPLAMLLSTHPDQRQRVERLLGARWGHNRMAA